MRIIQTLASPFLIFSLFLSTILFAYQTPQNNDSQSDSPSELELAIQKEIDQVTLIANQGAFDEAIQGYQTIFEKCHKEGLNEKTLEIGGDILYLMVLRNDKKITDKQKAIEDWYKNPINTHYKGLFNAAKAHLYAYYGQIDSMQYYKEKSSEIFTANKKYKKLAKTITNIAFEMYYIEEYSLAKQFIDEAYEVLTLKLIPNNQNLSIIFEYKSLIYAELGKYKIAIKNALSSIKAIKEDTTKTKLELALAYSRLAGLYGYTNDYNNSLDYYLKALDIFQKEDASNDYLATENYNIGVTYSKMQKPLTAKKHFLQSIDYLNKCEQITDGTLMDYINNYQELANYFLSEGMLDSAEHYIVQAKEVQAELPYRVATSMRYHAEIYLAKGELEQAAKELDKALPESRNRYGEKYDLTATLYQTYADLCLRKGKNKEALAYIQQALASLSVGFADKEGASNPQLEDVLYKRILLNVIDSKLRIMQTLKDSKEANISTYNIYQTASLATETLELMNRSLKNKASKRFWLNQKAIPLFEKAIQIAINTYQEKEDKKYLNEAFELSERSKSMLMMDALQEANANSFGGVPDSLISKEQALDKSITKAEKRKLDARLANDAATEKEQDSLLFKLKHQIDALKHTFEANYPKYYELKYKTKVASISQVQEQLDQESNFIEYFEGKQKVYVFSITKEKATVEVISKGQKFDKDIHKFQKALSTTRLVSSDFNGAYNQFVELSTSFYEQLLAHSIIENKKRLIIIPDGQIGYLPFEVLLTQEVAVAGQKKNEASFVTLPYLLKKYKISYNYSGTLLISQKQAKHQVINGQILAMAPHYSEASPDCRSGRETNIRKELIELPGAASEVAMLNNKYKGTFLLGKDAHELALKDQSPKHGILHLAMHGLVDKENPELSGLAMTETADCNEDNFMYSYEIKQQALQAGLVVLSACQTGIGKYQRGEGVVSIGRGFMYAGSPSLLMTLWSLNDQSGALIIEHFYKNLTEGMEKDEAIRQAKLKYLENCNNPIAAHPFLWAPFIQVGDYSTINLEQKSNTMLWLGGGLLVIFLGIAIPTFARRRKAA